MNGWADTSLKLLGYDNNPQSIQYLIEYSLEECIKKIKFDDVEMSYVALH